VLGYFVLEDDEEPHFRPCVAKPLIKGPFACKGFLHKPLNLLVALQPDVRDPDSLEIIFPQ